MLAWRGNLDLLHVSLSFSQRMPGPTADPEAYVIVCKGSTVPPTYLYCYSYYHSNCFTYIAANSHSTAKPLKMNLPDDGEGALSGGTVECVWPGQTSCL